jgi:16S rRNA (cytosine1402-N4)-methyltransferase
MLQEVIAALAPQDGKVYVDSTFGAGGYSRAILEAAACTVYGIDRDPDAVKRGKQLENIEKRFTILEGNFSNLDHLLKDANVGPVDGIVFDLGVSSPQLDEADRGFSFQKDGPLDMRMEKKGPTAADVINTLSEKELADIFWRYGDEPKSRAIAKAIVEQRKTRPFTRTLELADLIHTICKKKPHQKIDPATKTFQALRIHLNQELQSLEKGLQAAEKALAPQGRLVVVSFHALEDERVKKFLRQQSGDNPNPSRHCPVPLKTTTSPSFLTRERKSQKPSTQEIAQNPRARSARLRWAIRTAHAVQEGSF